MVSRSYQLQWHSHPPRTESRSLLLHSSFISPPGDGSLCLEHASVQWGLQFKHIIPEPLMFQKEISSDSNVNTAIFMCPAIYSSCTQTQSFSDTISNPCIRIKRAGYILTNIACIS